MYKIIKKLKNIIKIFYNKNAIFTKYFENYHDIKKKIFNVKAYKNFNLKFVKHHKLEIEDRFFVSIKELRKSKKQNINILEIGSGYSFISLISKKLKDFYCLQSSRNHNILYHVISLPKLKNFFFKNNLHLVLSNFYNYEKNLFKDGLYSKVELTNLIFKKYKQ